MITVDNRSVNMTLTNELKISFLSFWPLAMSLIKANVRQHPAAGGVVQQHSEFLNRLTPESLFFSASAPLFVETQVRIYLLVRLSSKTSLVFVQSLSALCKNVEKLGWKAKNCLH